MGIYTIVSIPPSYCGNHSYLAAVMNTNQLFVVVERKKYSAAYLISQMHCSWVHSLVCSYYTFSMSYPQPLKAVMMFIQRILNFDDGEPAAVPESVHLS